MPAMGVGNDLYPNFAGFGGNSKLSETSKGLDNDAFIQAQVLTAGSLRRFDDVPDDLPRLSSVSGSCWSSPRGGASG